MARRERFANDAETTITSAIGPSDTSINVQNAADFPTEGDFKIVIDHEIINVTSVSGNTFTVERGAESTTAANHVANSQVSQIITVGSLETYTKESADPYFGSKPAYRIADSVGDLLTHSDFLAFGAFTGATASTNNGVVSIQQTPRGSLVLAPLVRTSPSTPYTITSAITGMLNGTVMDTGPTLGFCFAESASNKLVVLSLQPTNESHNYISVRAYNSVTSFNSTLITDWKTQISYPFWCRLDDNGTNIKFDISHNGVNFVNVYDALRGAFFTTGPDRVGFFVNSVDSSFDNIVNLVAWSEE